MVLLRHMRIKLSIPGQGEKLNLSQFTGNNDNVFAGCKFFVNEPVGKADAWFVVEDVDPNDNRCEVPLGQLHFLSAEASWRPDKFLSLDSERFLNQFAGIHSCHPIRLPSVNFTPPFLPWMINANHETIFNTHERDIHYFEGPDHLKKERPLSVFCSAQGWTPEHRLRLAFVEHLKKELGEDLDWFGNGVSPVDEKWQGLAMFEHTLVLENRSDRGIFTEKILDAYLGLSVPIYWGAPDIGSYLPVPPSHQINIADFRGATIQIRNLLSTGASESDRHRLIEGKTRVLNELHFLNRIADIAKSSRPKNPKPVLMILKPRESFVRPQRTSKSLTGKTKDFLFRKVYRPLKKAL